ncbi:MAG: GFA family protein [Gammaproteobacteria bacterium]
MITASCHCGRAKLEVARAPRTLSDCNCSMCRRYGALWAYYKAGAVRLRYRRSDVDAYSWGDRMLRFIRCRSCGCVLHHERASKTRDSTIGANARNFEPAVIAKARVRHLDGAKTWKYVD